MAIDYRRRVMGVWLTLFVVGLGLSAFTARRPMIAASIHGLTAEVLRPMQLGSSYIVETVSSLVFGYVALVGTQAENELLSRRLAVLEAHQSQVAELEREVQRLRELLSLRESFGAPGVAARVISHDASSWSQTVTVNRGSQHGIEIGAAVVQRYGLVGQVIATTLTTSKVLLITDPASGVDGIVQNSRVRGVVEGVGLGRCMWRFVLRDAPLTVGERVLASGMDGVFPRGILVGIVASVSRDRDGLFQTVEIEPTVDFSELEEVLVLPKGVLEAPPVVSEVFVPPQPEASS